jgi:lipopolysaccharide export system permease protein
MLKIIDRYIIGKFIGTFFYLIFLFLAIAVVIDITEKIDDFVSSGLSAFEIVKQYYIHFLPWIGLMLSPIFVFISVIFFNSRLAGNSEIISMLSNGISFYRLLVPYMISALILTGVFYYFNHYALPESNKKRVDFEREYINVPREKRDRYFHLQVNPDTLVFFRNYSESDQSGYSFTLEVVKEKKLLYKLSADKVKWNSDSSKWFIQNLKERTLKEDGDEIVEIYETYRDMGFVPDDIDLKIDYKEAMTTKELNEYIEKQRMSGSIGLEFYLVEKYKRTAVPFSTIILTLIAVAMTSKKSRGGMGLNIVLGLSISGLFIITQQFSTVFSTKGNFDPKLGSWLPDIIFGIVSILLLFRAPK